MSLSSMLCNLQLDASIFDPFVGCPGTVAENDKLTVNNEPAGDTLGTASSGGFATFYLEGDPSVTFECAIEIV